MTIETRTYYGLDGAFSINDPSLINVKVVRVKRRGTGFNPASATPGNREFAHTQSVGLVEFSSDDPFVDPPSTTFTPFPTPEKVMITIKY